MPQLTPLNSNGVCCRVLVIRGSRMTCPAWKDCPHHRVSVSLLDLPFPPRTDGGRRLPATGTAGFSMAEGMP